MYDCVENKGNRLDVDSDNGEAMLTIYSDEMNCELVVCLSYEDTERLKKQISQI